MWTNECLIQIYFSRWSKPCEKLSWYGGLVKIPLAQVPLAGNIKSLSWRLHYIHSQTCLLSPLHTHTYIYIHTFTHTHIHPHRPRFLCRSTALTILLQPLNDRGRYIRKTADSPLQLWVSTLPRDTLTFLSCSWQRCKLNFQYVFIMGV